MTGTQLVQDQPGTASADSGIRACPARIVPNEHVQVVQHVGGQHGGRLIYAERQLSL